MANKCVHNSAGVALFVTRKYCYPTNEAYQWTTASVSIENKWETLPGQLEGWKAASDTAQMNRGESVLNS